MSVFRLYNENGSIAFDNSTSVFGLVKAGRLTRPNPTDTPSKLKNYWLKQLNDPIMTDVVFREYRNYYRNNPNPAKDFYDVHLKNVSYQDGNGTQRTTDLRPLRGFLERRYIDDDFYLAGKSYYIDVVCESTPMVFLHCDLLKPKYSGLLYKTDYDESPFLGLTHSHTKKLSDNLYRIVYVSAMPLSDRELERFRVYVFGLTKHKANTVGLNLYDEQGNLTFSSANTPLKVSIKPLKLSKDPNDRKVFINENGWQDNTLGDYTFCHLEPNRRYAVMGGGLTELIDRPHRDKNVPFDVSPRDSFGWKVHYHDWDWLSSPQFGVVGLVGCMTAFLGSGYYLYADHTRRSTATHIEFDWRNPNKTQVELLVTDVTHLPFPFN